MAHLGNFSAMVYSEGLSDACWGTP